MYAALFLSLSLQLSAADQAPQPAAEADQAAPAAGAAKPGKADGSRLVCRREAKPNTRFTTKVCKTADEWEARAEAARAAFAETQSRPMISTDKGS